MSKEGIIEGRGPSFEGVAVGGGVGGRGKDGREAILTRRGEMSCSCGEPRLLSVSVVLVIVSSSALIVSILTSPSLFTTLVTVSVEAFADSFLR